MVTETFKDGEITKFTDDYAENSKNVGITEQAILDKGYSKVPVDPDCPPPTDEEIRELGYIKPGDCPEGPPVEPPPTDLEELAFNTNEGEVDFDLEGINQSTWPADRLKEENKDDLSEGKLLYVDCRVGQLRMHPQVLVGDITLTPEGFIDIKADWQRDQAGRPRHHHTEIGIVGKGWRDGGRSMNTGQWTKQVTKYTLPNFVNDDQWKIIGQYHGWGDSGEGGRNPSTAISLRDRENGCDWIVRADSKPITPDNSSYTRTESWDELVPTPRGEDVTIIVEHYVWLHHTLGSSTLIVNGNLIHEEVNIGNMFNDQRGPIWSMGLYKYFNSSNEPSNHIIIERALSMRVSGPRSI